VNNSRNNTGLQQLPPAQPAFIWYPYAASPDFPQVGSGGRNAMAGPVYYADMFPKETRYPDYYNGKLFTYDWIRGWIKPVTMQKNGDFDKMEPFMQNTKFSNPIDMEVGPDGRLYVLEYGSGWFAKNPDAGLARLDYNGGNRPPKIAGIQVNKTSGTLPFTITAKVDAKDPEKEALKYVWDLGNGTKKETDQPSISYTYNTPGEYAISVTVTDKEKATAKSEAVSVYAGNEAPVVNIQIKGNQTFYFPGKPVQYAVSIEDRDDTAKVKDINNLIVSAEYTEQKDKAALPQGHQVLTSAMVGKNLVQSLDCKACHKLDEKSVGPAYQMVSERYQKNPDAISHLTQKIIKGGSGVWGEVAMPAHPNMKESDARQIVDYILSLAKKESKTKSLPAAGNLSPTLSKPVKDDGVLFLTASYTDKGGNNIKPLTGNSAVALRNSKVTFDIVKRMEGFTSYNFNGSVMMVLPATAGWFSIDSIDLTAVNGATISLGWVKPPVSDHSFEIHLDAPNGQKLGEVSFAPASPVKQAGYSAEKPTNKFQGKILTTHLTPVNDGKLHNVYIVSKTKSGNSPDQMAMSFVQFNSK
jgi:cytochrome c551/c552